ncbi:MAG: hypothetical protein WC378_03900 [Opitutaceae bacterium]|jgi:hypothetical protein
MRRSVFIVLLALAGCATPRRQTDAEVRGYERGYAQAVKEQYWILQNQQRTAPPAQTPATP